MKDYFKYNVFVWTGVFFSITAIIIGFILNIGGVVLAALLTLLISIIELIRKFFREIRYKKWTNKHSNQLLLQLYSEEEFKPQSQELLSLSKEQYLILSDQSIKKEILLDLARRNSFTLDNSFAIQISPKKITVLNIQKEFNSYLKKAINMTSFIEKVEKKFI